MTSPALVRERVRAGWWAVRATGIARSQIRRAGVEALDVPPAPMTPAEAKGLARLAVCTLARNCLVQAAVRQAWYAGQGVSVDLVVGVTPPSDGFRAHAWLAIDPPDTFEGYEELLRRPSRRPA